MLVAVELVQAEGHDLHAAHQDPDVHPGQDPDLRHADAHADA